MDLTGRFKIEATLREAVFAAKEGRYEVREALRLSQVMAELGHPLSDAEEDELDDPGDHYLVPKGYECKGEATGFDRFIPVANLTYSVVVFRK